MFWCPLLISESFIIFWLKKTTQNLLKNVFLVSIRRTTTKNSASNLLTHISKIPKDLDKIYLIHTTRNRNSVSITIVGNTALSLWGHTSFPTGDIIPINIWVLGVSEVSSLGCHRQQASFWELTSLHHFFKRHAMVAVTLHTVPSLSGHFFFDTTKDNNYSTFVTHGCFFIWLNIPLLDRSSFGLHCNRTLN